jgi:hypothetical protein
MLLTVATSIVPKSGREAEPHSTIDSPACALDRLAAGLEGVDLSAGLS